MPSYTHAVLIGSAGTGTAFAAASALRRVWSREVRIVAMDTNPRQLVTASLLANDFVQVPASADPQFADCLRDVVRDYNVDTYLPLVPMEIELAASLIHSGELAPVRHFLGPNSSAATLCADKLLLVNALLDAEIPVPPTQIATDVPPQVALLAKPRRGFGSRGVFEFNGADVRGDKSWDPTSYILQEYCQAPEITVDAFCDPAKRVLIALCRERLEVKTGVCTKARLFHDSVLEGYAARVAAALHLRGVFCFQVMSLGGNWVVTDVNPRPGAGTAMCRVTGNDLFAAAFAHAWGQPYESYFAPLRDEIFVTRQYCEFAMTVCDANSVRS